MADTIEKIKSTVDIVEFVSQYVSILKKGDNYFGKCPFHGESNASFSVSEKKQMYYCFGCHAYGDVIDFHARFNGISDIKESIADLCYLYGIEINEKYEHEYKAKSSKYEVNKTASEHFSHELHTNKNALSYVNKRGLGKETIERFGIGYANSSWDNLKKTLGNIYPIDECVDSGLLVQKNSHCYDRFRNRIIFPVHNSFGKVIGFGGRTIDESPDVPKYINSPESEVFKKKNSLYGLYQAKDCIAREKHAYVVEGYLDVLTMHQSEFYNVVAALGTSFTKEQAQIISNLVDKITLVFDGDKSGLEATIKSIEKILACGIYCDVVVLPKNKDIDDFINENGVQETKHLFERSVDGVEFYVSALKKEAPKNMSKLISKFLSSIEDELVKSYCKNKIKDILGVTINNKKKKVEKVESLEKISTREKEALYCLAYGAYNIENFKNSNGHNLFKTDVAKSVYKKIIENNDKESVYLSLSEKERFLWHEVVSLEIGKDLQVHLANDIEKLLKKEQRKSRRDELRDKIAQLESSNDFLALRNVLAEFKAVMHP